MGIGRQREKELDAERVRYLEERDELEDKLQASDDAKLKTQHAEGEAHKNQLQALDKAALEAKVLAAVKEAQHSQNELVKCRAHANIVCVELQDLKLRLKDLGGANVYSANRQQADENLETKLQEARDELAEMSSCLDDARRYLREAKTRLGDELEQLEARVEQLEGENGVLVKRAEASEKATKAALPSGSAHTGVWDQSPATKEAQLMAIKEVGESLLRAFEADLEQGGQANGRGKEEARPQQCHTGRHGEAACLVQCQGWGDARRGCVKESVGGCVRLEAHGAAEADCRAAVYGAEGARRKGRAV